VLPGKTYTPEEILGIAWRRKWLIAVPFVVATVCTVIVASRLPKRYQSETVILVVPQRVPESFVRSTVTNRIEDRLPSLREQILSRTRLERVITQFGLYSELQKKAVMEDVVEAMRRDIDIKVERGDSFRISYINEIPETAQQVTERLASLFIQENVRDRTVQAEGTNQFLDAQMEEARAKLLDHEKKLEEYQRRYAGELPNQVAGPDVRAQKATIRELEAKLQAENANRPPASDSKPLTLAEASRQKRVRDLNSEIQNLDTQLDRKHAQERQLDGDIASYQAKVNAAPTREAELKELNRDYETLQNTYTSFLSKRQDAKVAANLERTQSGEQFRVLDPARVPERPYSPKIMKIDIAGALLGLAIGVGIVGLLEYRDSTFKTGAEVQQLLQLPVLALVPMMASEMERRDRQRRGKLVALAVAVIIVSSAVAVLFWKIQTS
jgi:uncharacterized protein involved in exopolysaccharide biosynthesis